MILPVPHPRELLWGKKPQSGCSRELKDVFNSTWFPKSGNWEVGLPWRDWRILTHMPHKGWYLEKIAVTTTTSTVNLVLEKHPQPWFKTNLNFFPAHYFAQWWNARAYVRAMWKDTKIQYTPTGILVPLTLSWDGVWENLDSEMRLKHYMGRIEFY